MALKQILIIDDDVEDRFLIEIAFKDIGFGGDITFAEDGIKALTALTGAVSGNKDLPKLLVLDLNMPRMSGTELLKQIKEHPDYKNIQVVIFSTAISEWDRAECVKYGVTNYVVKPVTYNEFLSTARSFHDIALAS